jgi:hypothetical protein
MPDVFGPFDTSTWSQAGWFRDAWARARSGVYGVLFTDPAAGDLALTVAGLTVSMGLGRAHVRGAGYERTGSAWTYDTPPNTDPNPRVDRLVLRRDLAAQTVVPAVLQGAPAAAPAVPALTQNEDGVWELPLFRYTVPGNSGAPVTGVVDERVPSPLTRLTAPEPPVTTGFVAASGWAMTNPATNELQKLGGGRARLYLAFQRTGASIAVNTTTGKTQNIELGTLPDAFAAYNGGAGVVVRYGSGGAFHTGRLITGALVGVGLWLYGALGSSSSIAVGDVVGLNIEYPLATP